MCHPNGACPLPSRFAVNHVSGLFRNASAKYAQGLCPDRAAQGASPIFRASLVQTGLSAASASLRWGDPSPCALLPPPSPGGVRHVHAAFQRGRAKAKPKEEAPMNTTSTVTPISETPKQPQQRQTAKDIIAANVKSLIEQLRGRTLRRTHRLPRRDEPIPQLQLRKHSGDCTAEADRNPRCWPVRMEPAWPEGEERRERDSHSCPHRRHQAQEGRGSRTRTSPSRTPASWLASAMLTSSMWSRPKAQSFPPCGR